MSGAAGGRAGGPGGALTRRGLLVGGGAAAAGAVTLAACGSISIPPQKVAVMADADAKGAALLGGLELVAISVYQNAAAPGAVKLPAAVTSFATTAMSHHQRALDQWNSALALSQGTPVSQPLASLKATVDQSSGKVTDAKTFARLALLVEQTLSDTYLATLPKLQAKSAITLAGAILTLDGAHVALLHFMLGEYPVPDPFLKADRAVTA